MTDNLRKFLEDRALNHFPFKRECDNELYQQKYVEIFEYILNKVPGLDESVNISATEFKKIYRNYKQVLIDLYNDKLIFFRMSKSKKELLHGNKRWAKSHDDKGEGSFVGFYRVDSGFVSSILNDTFDDISVRYIDRYEHIQIYTDIHITNQMKSDVIRNKYYEHQNHETVTKSSNGFYDLLTIRREEIIG